MTDASGFLFPTVLILQKKQHTADGQAGRTVSYIEYARVFGRVSSATMKDFMNAGKKESKAMFPIFIKVGQAVPAPGDRIVAEGRTFEVRTGESAGIGYPYSKVLATEYDKGRR